MNINVTARNFHLTEGVKEIAEQRLLKLTRYHEGILAIDCLLEANKREEIAVDVNVQTRRGSLHAEDCDSDLRTAVDQVAHKLERQAKRQKSKRINGHHKSQDVGSAPLVLAPRFGDAEEEEVKRRVLAKTANSNLDSMALEEAVMRMDHDGREVLIFSNSETEQVNVVYRRRDGAVGLID